MNTGAEQSVIASREKVRAKVTDKVNALENLTDMQRLTVLDICLAHAVNHSGAEPSYEGIARHVRNTVKS